MPDLCPTCDPPGTYYPYRWGDGTAHYLCAWGHRWTAGWAMRKGTPGEAPEWCGRPAPVVPVVLAVEAHAHSTRRGAERSVVVECPYCARRHTHGWPLTDPDVGLRTAHCAGADARTYRVTVNATEAP